MRTFQSSSGHCSPGMGAGASTTSTETDGRISSSYPFPPHALSTETAKTTQTKTQPTRLSTATTAVYHSVMNQPSAPKSLTFDQARAPGPHDLARRPSPNVCLVGVRRAHLHAAAQWPHPRRPRCRGSGGASRTAPASAGVVVSTVFGPSRSVGTPWGEPRIEDCVFDRCRRKGFIHHQADLINCRFIGKMNGCIWNGTSPVHRRGRRNLIHGNDFSKAIIAPDPAWRSGLQLRRGGRPRDLARQGSSWDAHASIDVLLLCGAGLAKTKQYLAERSDGEAHAAHEYLLRCEAAADSRGSRPPGGRPGTTRTTASRMRRESPTRRVTIRGMCVPSSSTGCEFAGRRRRQTWWVSATRRTSVGEFW